VTKRENIEGAAHREERDSSGIRARGEEALSDLAEALLDNPIFHGALSTAAGAGERAAQAQRTAMGALNIPASSDVERLEQRIRSLSGRLESVEDQLDEVMDELAALRRRLEDAARQAEPVHSEDADG
jgi:GTP1/Obg family GTP-binding protein